MDRPEHILIRGLNWLGDAIMATPALQQLRNAKPEAHITVLSHEKLATLWKHQPFVDEVITFATGQSLWQTARGLRPGAFDIGIALPNSVRSALELWLARIPKRVGYARPWRTFFLSHPVKPRAGSIPMRKRPDREIRRLSISGEAVVQSIPAAAHHVHDYLQLMAALGAVPEPIPPRILVAEDEIKQTAAAFGIGRESQALWCGLNPGAEYGPAKRWPAERFVTAAIELHRQIGCKWMVFGGQRDVTVAEQICAEIDRGTKRSDSICLNLAGRTDLRQLGAALKLCRLVITNDTGPMHLASAVGTPVIVPFGSTSPEMTGPVFAGNARILKTRAACAPCFRRVCPIDLRCLLGIEPQEVVRAALEIVR